MPAATVFQIPQSARDALETLSNGNISHTLKRIILENEDTNLVAPDDPPTRTGIVCDPNTIAILDAIVTRNKLKSRNQAITLLIEHAWRQKQQTPD